MKAKSFFIDLKILFLLVTVWVISPLSAHPLQRHSSTLTVSALHSNGFQICLHSGLFSRWSTVYWASPFFCSSNTSNEMHLRTNLFPHSPTTSLLSSPAFPISVSNQHCHLPRLFKKETSESRPFSPLSPCGLLFLPLTQCLISPREPSQLS